MSGTLYCLSLVITCENLAVLEGLGCITMEKKTQKALTSTNAPTKLSM